MLELIGFVLATLVLLMTPLVPPSTLPTPHDGLVAAWSGESNAQDARGRDPGTVYGGVTYVPFLGKRAWHFNGHGSVVFVPDFKNLHLGHSLTIAATVEAEQPLEGSPGLIVFRGDNRPGLDPYSLALQPARGKQTEVLFLIQGSSPYDSQAVSAPIPLRRPVQLVGTLDDASGWMRLYVNGQQVAMTLTRTRPATELDNGQDPGLSIGNTQDPATYNEPFLGIIGDVRIYDRALTPAEVKTMAAGVLAMASPAHGAARSR